MTDPRFRAPMLATLVEGMVDGPDWVFERKYDGIRIVAVRDGADVRLYSRNRIQQGDTYPELVDALAAQPVDRFVVDGEVVAFDGDVTSFARLQQRSGISHATAARRSAVPVYLYLFDLLHLDGHDTVDLPLRDRTSLLDRAIDVEGPLRVSAQRHSGGAEYLADACAEGWEGLIAKRVDRPYRSGRSRDWVKLKCVARQEMVIGGFTEPKGARAGLGALLVGHHDDSGLRYAGRVGTGFDERMLVELADLLGRREQPVAAFVDPPRLAGVHWVTPDLVAEVGFSEWTAAGLLRHPRFLGLRRDKDPSEVVREAPRSAP